MSKCRSCAKDVIWRKHTRSRQSMPIDVVPRPGGNLAVLDGENYEVVTDKDEIARRADLHFSHYATCPYAKQHRKEK